MNESDPQAPGLSPSVPSRGALVEWLTEHGASSDEVERAAATGQWNMLSGEVALRTGKPTLSLRDAASRVGRPYEEVAGAWRSAGFVVPEDDSPVLTEAEVDGFFAVLALALQLFGLDATLQLTRVLSSSVATIADALIALFHTGLGLQAATEDPSGLAVAHTASAAAAPLEHLGRAVELLLRRHIISLMRPLIVPDEVATDTTQSRSRWPLSILSVSPPYPKASLLPSSMKRSKRSTTLPT